MRQIECVRTLAINTAGWGWEGRVGRRRRGPKHLVLHLVLARGIFLVPMTLMHLVLHLVLARGLKITGVDKRRIDRLWANLKRRDIVLTKLGQPNMPSDPINKRRDGLKGASRKRSGSPRGLTYKRRSKRRGEVNNHLGPPCT
jgi:hypothetical protein